MWQHIQNSINSRLDDIMDTLRQKLNKKLHTLIRHTHITYNDVTYNDKNTHTHFTHD